MRKKKNPELIPKSIEAFLVCHLIVCTIIWDKRLVSDAHIHSVVDKQPCISYLTFFKY